MLLAQFENADKRTAQVRLEAELLLRQAGILSVAGAKPSQMQPQAPTIHLEPFVYDITSRLSREYNGGYWEFYTLSNGGFYVAPDTDRIFHVTSENGFEGKLSGDALGITACLYACTVRHAAY